MALSNNHLKIASFCFNIMVFLVKKVMFLNKDLLSEMQCPWHFPNVPYGKSIPGHYNFNEEKPLSLHLVCNNALSLQVDCIRMSKMPPEYSVGYLKTT